VDETSLRAELERALSAEPPLGHLVSNSLRAGHTLRRRRRAAAAVLSAAAIVAVSAVPALTLDTGHKVSKAPRAAPPPAAARTAYVAVGFDTVMPISLATSAVGTPIKVDDVGMMIGSPGLTSAAAAPDGRTVYELGMTYDPDLAAAVTPIDGSTNAAGKAITLPTVQPFDIAIDPNGKTAYVSADDGVFPINLATNTAGKEISIPGRGWTMAFAPDGKKLYVLDNLVPAPRSDHRGAGALTSAVTPIRTATNTALAPIKLPKAAGYLFDIAITPNGATAYVLDDVGGWSYANSVIPIDLVSGTPLAPIKIKALGQTLGLVISPGGHTAYVLSTRAVTPIDTATNQAEPAINLSASAGNAYRIALTPNGKTLYVLTPRGVIPISTASRTALPMISIPHLPSYAYYAIAITPDGSTVYVDTATGVLPIRTATNTAGKPIDLGARPPDSYSGAITFGG
jgi:DNA-binding beta-propeller fold protein YncE